VSATAISTPRRWALPTAIVAAALGVAAPTASALSLTPDSHDFGIQTVGTMSSPQPFTLTVRCVTADPLVPDLCLVPDVVTPAASIAGGDFAQTNDCPPTLISTLLFLPVSCTMNVTFTPTASGPRAGTLTAGGFAAALSGTGVAPAAQSPTFDLAAAIKRCKKKLPKGPKRKRCIKRAKARARG